MIKAGFIGCGNMGGVLAGAAAKSGMEVYGADLDQEKLRRLQSASGVVPSTTEEIAGGCDYIFLGVKPQMIHALAEQIRTVLGSRRDRFVVVSMAAGIPISRIEEELGAYPVIRIMPNTPAAVGEGMILYSPSSAVTEEEENTFLKLLANAGRIQKLDESKIDAACAISGCGPAFVCMFVEAMMDAGIRCGLTRDLAKLLSLQTVAGTARLALGSDKDPAVLRGEVCSPAGSTIEGVAALEANGFRSALLDAVEAAYQRTLELKG